MPSLPPLAPRGVVLLAGPLHGDALRRLEEATEVRPIDPAELADPARRFPGVHGLVVRAGTPVEGPLLDRMPDLEVIARPGAGVDDIDLAACAEREVIVVHAPGANTTAVAEYVFALLLARIRPVAPLAGPLDEAGWRAARAASAPFELAEHVLGIVGLGRIGSRVARIAAGFEMTVRWHDLLAAPPTAEALATTFAERLDFDELVATSDVLTLHVDGRPSNRHLLDAGVLARMPEDAILVNTSRGSVVDSIALARWLRDHPDAAAILDVHETEPIPADHPLWDCPNAWLLPHLAARTDAALEAMSDAVDELLVVLDGEEPDAGTVARPPAEA